MPEGDSVDKLARRLDVLVGRRLSRGALRVPQHAADDLAGPTVDGPWTVVRDTWVAGRLAQPCRRCGTLVAVAAEEAGSPDRRRTWWCPRCQPGPARTAED